MCWPSSPVQATRSILCLIAASLYSAEGAAQENPASYCASAGHKDEVKPIPASLLESAVRMYDPEARHRSWVKESTVYRCMAGAVWLCNHGANLTCAKADARRSIPAVSAYCRENANAEVVPAVVTGHGTSHTWKCVRGEARISESLKLDERGFLADEWTRLK